MPTAYPSQTKRRRVLDAVRTCLGHGIQAPSESEQRRSTVRHRNVRCHARSMPRSE
jgi:hypothetical protein